MIACLKFTSTAREATHSFSQAGRTPVRRHHMRPLEASQTPLALGRERSRRANYHRVHQDGTRNV